MNSLSTKYRLVVDRLQTSYADGAPVLDGVSFSVEPGQLHAVVGESGSGKTTLLRSLNGSLPRSAATTGRLVLVDADGGETDLLSGAHLPGLQSLLRPTSPLAGRVIGTVPQSAMTALTPVRTLGSQLAETCRVLGAKQTPNEILNHVGLQESDGDLYPHQLSGGMAQRAALALAMAGDPPILLADEPTSALDPDLTAALLARLRKHADGGATVLLITHDIEELERTGIADQISVLHRGALVESGASASILSAPRAGYTRNLLAALPSRGLQAIGFNADIEEIDR